jgi:phosphatidylethanolamine-binding protein (PEBP) family uncharacterized protein
MRAKILWGIILVLMSLLVAGCGGSGGDNSSASAPKTVTGVASGGAAMTGTVYLKDSKGVEKNTVIGVGGSFTIVVDDLTAPFLLKAVSADNATTLYSFSPSNAPVNINPFTSVAVAAAAGTADLDTLYKTTYVSQYDSIKSGFSEQVSALKNQLGALFTKFNVIDTDFLNGNIEIGKGVDAVFDNITVDINQTTKKMIMYAKDKDLSKPFMTGSFSGHTMAFTSIISENLPTGTGTPGASMNTAQTVSDQAQSMTIAFDGLAFVTGSFCAQTFYPPGKVADFFGFQYLRDNDPSAMGHNTDFTTLTADPILVLLNDAQLKILSDLGTAEATLNDNYGYARFPLAKAFRRLNDGDLPAGKTGLSRDAVKAYSAYLFSIDGEMSYLRAKAYASVLGSMDATQRATLAAIKGKGSLEWTQPTQVQVAAVLAKYPGQMMRTYAGEMLAWYLGNIDADVYFCPERQGTYFGSFFMKDIKAMNNPSYTIDSNMTAEMGDAFLASLNTVQKAQVTGLVTEQKADLISIVAKRDEISSTLRNFLRSGGTVDKATVISLARRYGELDGDISYLYATRFSSVGTSLTSSQKTTLTALRKTATAETGGSPDYDNLCGNGYLYSAPLKTLPTVMNTDFMFGVCRAAGSTCSTNWDCCSFSCGNNVCGSAFTLTSTAFVDGGAIPGKYTCDGTAGMLSPSPPLAWSGAPEGTVEFALTISTIALDGTKWNWVLFNIPGTVTSLAEGTAVGTAGVSTDGPDLRYYPPCSSGPGEKTYTFTLYALSGTPTFSVPKSQVTGAVLTSAISPLIIGSRQVNVTYTRTGL